MGKPEYDIVRQKNGSYTVWHKDIYVVAQNVTIEQANAAVLRHAKEN